MSRFRKLSQTIWHCQYHIVWTPKCRYRAVTGDIAEEVDGCIMTAPKNRKFRFKNKLLSMDSSTIALCLSIFPWAEFRRTKGGVKLHLLLDHDGYFPTYAYVSNGNKHDVTIVRKVPLPPCSIVTMDRGKSSFSWSLFNRSLPNQPGKG